MDVYAHEKNLTATIHHINHKSTGMTIAILAGPTYCGLVIRNSQVISITDGFTATLDGNELSVNGPMTWYTDGLLIAREDWVI